MLAEMNDLAGATWCDLKHLDGVAEIEMEEFIAGQLVHGGKGFGREQVEDSGAQQASARVCRSEQASREFAFGPVALNEVPALDGVRPQA